MKKFLFFISLFIFFIVPVKAESLSLDYDPGYWSWVDVYSYSELESFITENSSIISQLKNNALQYYNSNYSSDFPYYIIGLYSSSTSYGVGITLSIQAFPTIPTLIYSEFSANASLTPLNSNLAFVETQYIFDDTTYINPYTPTSPNGMQLLYYSFQNTTNYNDYFSIEKNFDLIYDQSSYYDTVTINNFRNQGSLTFSKGDSVSISVSDMTNINYSTVNLDNYDYVLLTLKNYNQTNAFQTNLQVKGQIGITPIYNYGQTSKDAITGSQVQDRCNVSYTDYTTYPFYILQTDLQNNVIYAVKKCSNGSSFKYDTNIFDITYVTQENASNPTVTIGGQTYDVIPYDDLPSTATQNEVDNYIPGQSGSAVDSGGIDSAIKGVQQGLSTLWNTFTYFTDLVGLIFSSLPTELRTILLSAFVVAITIGLIKIFTK